jgi:hypothetical protein
MKLKTRWSDFLKISSFFKEFIRKWQSIRNIYVCNLLWRFIWPLYIFYGLEYKILKLLHFGHWQNVKKELITDTK